jgi:hypothetical protein
MKYGSDVTSMVNGIFKVEWFCQALSVNLARTEKRLMKSANAPALWSHSADAGGYGQPVCTKASSVIWLIASLSVGKSCFVVPGEFTGSERASTFKFAGNRL